MKPSPFVRAVLLSSVSSALWFSHTEAATLYWDGSMSTINADGGAGNWNNNSTTNWDTLPIGGADTVWLNTNPDFAIFGGTAGTVTLTSAITTGGMAFNTTGYTITTGANTLSFGAADNSIFFNNIAAAAITGTVGGSGNVVFSALSPVTAGALTLNGTSTGGWSGATTINPAITLNLSNDNQALNNTSAINLNGGGITLTNASATAATNNKIKDSAAISSNGGVISIINTSGTGVYAETIGSVALTTGQLNIGLNNDHTSAAGSQTLTLSGLTRTGATNTSTITFSAWTTGPNSTKNRIAVTGAADGFLGAWATTSTGVGAAAVQTDYAFITDVGGIKYVTAANIAASAENSASWTAGGNNVTLSGATALTGTRTLNSLRYTGSAGALDLGANNLETYGVLNGGSGLLTISGTGALTTPTGGGNLILTAGNNAITVSSPINNNGGNVTLVKSGGNVLTLSATTSNYSGGTVLNGGTLTITDPTNIGSGGITFNGAATLNMNTTNVLNFGTRAITVNEGGTATMTSGNGGKVFGGVLSGSGTLFANSTTSFTFSNTANTFSGTITSATNVISTYGLEFASIGDGVGAGLINLNSGSFRWIKASGGTSTFANRQFALSGTTGGGQITALGGSSAENLVINRDLLITGIGAKTLTLGGTNLGNNTFAGKITDGTDGGASVISLSKVDAGKWILSGSNTYTGSTTVTAGTLVISNVDALPEKGLLIFAGGTLESTVGSGAVDKVRYAATGGTITTSMGGSNGFIKFGTGSATLNSTNSFTGGITVGAGTLSVGAAATLGQDVSGNSILIRDGGVLTLAAAANSGSNQAITLSSSSKNFVPVLATGGGAGPSGGLAVLALAFNGLPQGTITQANTLGGVIAMNGVTGYNTNLSTVLTGKNLYLGAIGTSTFTGAAGTVAAGNGSLYRLGGGGGQITFNTTNLFTSTNGVQVGSTLLNGGGTVVIQAAQDYSGATAVSAGTLTLSGSSGSATGSSSFTLNGGRLFLDSSGTNNANRIGNVNVTLSNGGDLHLSGNASGTTEDFGDLNIGAGYSYVTATAVTAAATLAGTGFSRTNNGTALFRGTSLGQNLTAMGKVTLSNTIGLSFVGATTSLNAAATGDSTKDVKIIPYLIGANTPGGTGDTFVTYDATLGFRALSTTNQFNSTATAGTNVRLAAAQTGINTMSINSLIIANASSSTITDGQTLTVASGAVLFSAAGTIAPSTSTGILDFGTAEGIVTTVANGVISAKITGSGGLTKSGTGSLTLSNASNSFSGGIVVNGGTLVANVDTYLGGAANNITVNGNSQLGLGNNISYARNILLNNGSILTFSNQANSTFTGNVTGTGGLALNNGFGVQMFFNGIANTFEGPILISGAGTTGQAYRMLFASLADSATANGRIVFSSSSVSHSEGSVFEYTGGVGGNTSLVLDNRQIELASQTGNPTNGHQIRNNSVGTGTLTINTDLIVSTPVAQTLSLRGSNSGANNFGGIIGDGMGKVSLLKTDAGRWILSNANTFSGGTLVSGGTLEIGNPLALQNSPLDAANSVTGTVSVGLKTTVTTLTLGGLNGSKNFDTLFTTSSGGYGSVTALTLNPSAGVTTSYSGVIVNGASGMTLTKTGSGTQILTGASSYTGGTSITSGTLMLGAGGTTGSLSSSGVITNDGNLSFNRSDTMTQGAAFGTLITGSGKIIQAGSGITKLTGANDFTGATEVTSGTLEATAGDVLKSTSAVNISGGTLLLSGSGNRIKDAAGMVITTNSLSVPALTLSGNVTESVGALTLNSAGTSVIDLGAGTAVFTFANSSAASWSGLMQIWNWSGSLTGGGPDQLFFGSSGAGLTPAQVASLTFVDPAGLGSGSYGAQLLGTGELVPVPEPSPLLACSILLGIAGMQRRRKTMRRTE